MREQGQRGNAAVEFALSFVLIWTLFTGVFQFGYSMYVYDSLATAVAGGARYASHVDFDDPGHNFVTQVKNMTVYGDPNGTGNPLAPGLTAGLVSVTWTTDTMGVPQTITVGISSYTAQAIFHNYTFTNKPQVTVRYIGSYKTPG